MEKTHKDESIIVTLNVTTKDGVIEDENGLLPTLQQLNENGIVPLTREQMGDIPPDRLNTMFITKKLFEKHPQTSAPLPLHIRTNYIDRYIVYDDNNGFDHYVVRCLIYWIRTTPVWEEVYEKYRDDTEAVDWVQTITLLNKESAEYNETLIDELMCIVAHRPIDKHAERLRRLSELTGYAYSSILARDMDIRLRKERWFSPEQSIRSSSGRSYLLFRFYLNEKYHPYVWAIFEIAASCIVCGKEDGLFQCTCKNAFYCSRKHQISDWSEHSKTCKAKKSLDDASRKNIK